MQGLHCSARGLGGTNREIRLATAKSAKCRQRLDTDAGASTHTMFMDPLARRHASFTLLRERLETTVTVNPNGLSRPISRHCTHLVTGSVVTASADHAESPNDHTALPEGLNNKSCSTLAAATPGSVEPTIRPNTTQSRALATVPFTSSENASPSGANAANKH